jgi:hypothetical protein
MNAVLTVGSLILFIVVIFLLLRLFYKCDKECVNKRVENSDAHRRYKHNK